MSRRGVFSIVNTVLLGLAVAVMFAFPQYAGYALYAILGWIAAGLTLTWTGWATGPTPAPTAPAGAGGLPSAAPTTSRIDFCVFCGRRFLPGERVCVDCRHPLPGADA